MSELIKVSVILTSYNHAKYLREAIDSVLKQTFTDFELIIWDDASEDNSWKIIKSYSDSRIKSFRNEERKRGIWGINQAIADVAKGEYIAIHHSDDIWEPQKLEKQVAFLDENPHVGAVFSRALIIDESGEPFEDKSHFYYGIFDQPNRSRYEWLNYFFYHANALCHPSVLIRKTCYEDCGTYRYGLAQIPDLDMWVRLCLKYEIQVLPEKLIRFRVRSNEGNASGNRQDTRVRYQFEFLEVLNNYRTINTPEEFIKIFPNAEKYFEYDAYDLEFVLGMVALEPNAGDLNHIFGLQLLFQAVNDPERARKINEIYGFNNLSFIQLTAKYDIFSVETTRMLTADVQALSAQVVERDGQVQALSAQVAERDGQVQALSEQLQAITGTRAWRAALWLQRIRAFLLPHGSLQARVARKALSLLLYPFTVLRTYRNNRDVNLIRRSGLFDQEWYLAHNPDVAQARTDPARHYLRSGCFEGRDPGPNFSSKRYLDSYEDVKRAGINPLVHYLRHGEKEGRVAFSPGMEANGTGSEINGKEDFEVQQKKRSFVKTVFGKIVREIYFFYHRLPLPWSFRQKAQRLVYKFFPTVVDHYKRSINGIVNQRYFGSESASSSIESTLKKRDDSDKSGLALLSLLLDTPVPVLKSLLIPPPWQAENPEGTLNVQLESNIEAVPSQALFNIILFVNNSPAHLLYSCIRSVQRQTYRDWELEIYVNEGAAWKADALTVQFEAEHRIRVKSMSAANTMSDEFREAVQDVSGEYVILLNPYDELKPDALRQAANEIANSHCDLIYCPYSIPAEANYRNFFDNQDSPENIFFDNGIAFSQFIVWGKKYLESILPNHFNSSEEALVQIYNELIETHKPQLVKVIALPCYLFREIPGRTSIILITKDGHFDLLALTIPMHILVDARLMGRQTTGTERYMSELLKALSRLRKDYNLVLKAIVAPGLKESIDGVDFITSEQAEDIRNCDIFHKTFQASDARTLAEMALAPLVVYTPLDMILYMNPDYFFNEMDYYNYRIIMRSAANLSDKIISISHYGKGEIEALLDIPSGKVNPVYLGVNPERFSPERQEDRNKLALLKIPSDYFLYIGTDYPHKNLITLLRAFYLVIQDIPTAQLVLVGAKYYSHPQPEFDDLMRIMSGNILHLGHVSDEILPALYRNSRALIYPSLHEGFGLPILEAMLCGVPVIASHATSIPEVSGKEAAILVDGHNEKQMASAMLKIWDDPELRDQLVLAGYRNVVQFNWQETARQTIKSYRDTITDAIGVSPKRRIKGKLAVINELRLPLPTILIVTHIRFYPPAAGNEQRLFRLVKYFKKLGYRIVMLVNPFLETTKLDHETRSSLHQYIDYYEEIGDVLIDEAHNVSFNSEVGNEPILNKWKTTEESFCPDALMQRARSLIEQFSTKIILAEYIWTSRVFALAKPGTLKVIDTIDMFSQKEENVTKFGIQDGLAITAPEELAFINRSDVIIAIQSSEADAFRKLAPSCRILTAGIDFDTDYVTENVKADSISPTLLIVGSGNHINVHCVKEFLSEAWPSIRKETPSCKLKIVGKVCNSLTTRDQEMELIPYARDLDSLYKDATIVINPVYAGTGLKIKSVEALGHGKALVSWPEGVAGITTESNEPYIVINSWEEMAETINDLINNPHERHNLEEAAREFAKSKLSDKVVYREIADYFDAFSKRKLKVLCLYLRYGTNEYADGMSDLQNWYESKMANAKVTTWIIDNKIENEMDGIDLATGFRLLSGDNQQREFSAFQKVLTQHREEIESYDIIHFVTSAFNTLFTGYLDYFSMDQLQLVVHRPICLGHIDAYNEPIQLADEISQNWIRTCFFFMSPETVYSISSFVSFREERQFFDADGNFLNDGSLSENYKKYIKEWLNGEIIQGISWHSKISTPDAFMGKTLAILNEHMLSNRLHKAGINLVDFYWLKEKSGELYSSVDYAIPDCMEQIAFRQAGLFGSKPKEAASNS